MKSRYNLYVCVLIWVHVDASPWSILFHDMDVNKDGVLSAADSQKWSATFTDLHDMHHEEKQVIGGYIETLYKSCILGEMPSITEQQFIDANTGYESNYPDELTTFLTDCFYSIYVFADINHDTYLSETEYVTMGISHGMDEAYLRDAYQYYAAEGHVTISTAVSMMMSFRNVMMRK